MRYALLLHSPEPAEGAGGENVVRRRRLEVIDVTGQSDMP